MLQSISRGTRLGRAPTPAHSVVDDLPPWFAMDCCQQFHIKLTACDVAGAAFLFEKCMVGGRTEGGREKSLEMHHVLGKGTKEKQTLVR